MAERRNREVLRGSFLRSVVMSDKFLEMPIEARYLYFCLGVSAHDMGMVNNAKAVARSVGIDYSNLQILVNYGYLQTSIENDGNYKITHWYENNGFGETAKKRNNYEYRQWRKSVIDRDKKCVVCGSEKDLVAHHIKSFAEYPELRLDINNGVTMCAKCHNKLHGLEKRNGEEKNV